MVKAMGEASIKIHHDGQETNIFFHKFADVKPGIAIDLTKKFKGPSPIKRLFFSSKTKRKDKDALDEGKQYLQDEFAKQRVIDVNYDSIVELPSGMDLQEWLATNTIKFFEHINQLYGAISDYCTTTTCTCMSAPNNVQYQWVDDKGKKVKCTAPQYVDYVTLYTQKTICDESVFPTKYGNVFPASFDTTIKKVEKLLFHVVAHIYHSHFKQVLQLNLHGHLNTVTAHFIFFCKRFQLIDERELDVLDDLYRKLSTVHVKVIGKDDSKTSLSSNEMETATKESGDNNKSSSNNSQGGSPVKSVVPATPPNSQSSTPEKGMKTGMDVDRLEIHKGLQLTQSDFEENKENVISQEGKVSLQHQANGHARNSSST